MLKIKKSLTFSKKQSIPSGQADFKALSKEETVL